MAEGRRRVYWTFVSISAAISSSISFCIDIWDNSFFLFFFICIFLWFFQNSTIHGIKNNTLHIKIHTITIKAVNSAGENSLIFLTAWSISSVVRYWYSNQNIYLFSACKLVFYELSYEYHSIESGSYWPTCHEC